MKKIYILFLLLLFSPYLFAQDFIYGKVIKVADGDTITLLDKNKKTFRIRFYGIDCPEKGQDYYQVAKNYVSDKIFSKDVKVEIINKDRYNRSVGIVWYDKNKNLNIELINKGLAWHYKQFDKSKSFHEAENFARNSKLNIWQMKNPIAPWEFRKMKRTGNKK